MAGEQLGRAARGPEAIDAGLRILGNVGGHGHVQGGVQLRLLPPRESQLRARRIVDMGIALYAASAYLRDRGRPRSQADLSGHDVISTCGELARLPEVQWLSKVPGVRVVFRSNNFSALVAAAVSGLGVLPLAAPWGDRESRLTRLFDLPEVPPRPLWLVTGPGCRPAGRGARRGRARARAAGGRLNPRLPTCAVRTAGDTRESGWVDGRGRSASAPDHRQRPGETRVGGPGDASERR